MTARPKAVRYWGHLLFHTSWILMWLPGYGNSKKKKKKTISISLLALIHRLCSCLPLLLWAPAQKHAPAWTRSRVHTQPGLSSMRSSWAALSQSRELDYPQALKTSSSFTPTWEGMRSGAGDPHPDFLLVNQGRFLTGQMDDCFEKQWAPSRIFPQVKTNTCCGNVEMLLEDTWGANPIGKVNF